LLSSTWWLHDVEDVEGLCGKVLHARLRRWGATLSEQDNEDALSFLLGRSWVLYLKFDPWHKATYRRSFSTFLYRRLYSFEVVNWYRSRFRDDRYHREDAVVLSLDYDADGELGELDELVSDGEGDPADSCIDLGRVLAG
jgi:hypothetical protein